MTEIPDCMDLFDESYFPFRNSYYSSIDKIYSFTFLKKDDFLPSLSLLGTVSYSESVMNVSTVNLFRGGRTVGFRKLLTPIRVKVKLQV